MNSDQIKRLIDILLEKKVLVSGLSVQTLGLKLKMEVQGFIPLPSDEDMILDFESDFIIGMDKIRLKKYFGGKDVLLPLTRRVEILTKEKTFTVTNTLHLIEYEKASMPSSALIKLRTGKYSIESIAQEILKLSPAFSIKEITDNNNISKTEILYTLENNDYTFYRWQEDKFMTPVEFDERILSINHYQPSAIAKDFCCLCSYLNTVTGKVDYYLRSPYDLIIVPNSL